MKKKRRKIVNQVVTTPVRNTAKGTRNLFRDSSVIEHANGNYSVINHRNGMLQDGNTII